MVEPRIRTTPPPAPFSIASEAIELAEAAGLVLDDWQRSVLEGTLGYGHDRLWTVREVALVVPRQNGKGAVLEARELAGLFIVGEKLIIHSAHQFDTSLEAFRRLLALIEDTPELDRQVKRVQRSHGEEGIELFNRSRIRFRTRTKGGGRGFSCNCLILDEAMFLPEFAHGALLPTLSAQKNPQVWYAGSAVDQEVHEHGVVLSRLRERGIRGDDRMLAYFDWSLEGESPADVSDEVAADRAAWESANPGYRIRISPDQIELEHASLDPRGFAVERLGVGDWPRTDGVEETPITYRDWLALRDEESAILEPVCVAFDVSPERSTAIAIAGRREDGLLGVEISDHKNGTAWLAKRLIEIWERHEVERIVCDDFGPASSVVSALEEHDVPVTALSSRDHTRACGQLVDLVKERKLRHLGSLELAAAVRGARTRPLGDAWAWSRRSSTVDISPLVAATLCLYEAALLPEEEQVSYVY